MRITFVINASSVDAVETLRQEIERLRGEGHEVHPHLTFEGGDAHRLAYRAAATGSALIVAAGGDGTINEVVNGLHDYFAEVGSGAAGSGGVEHPCLGIIPLGTANDLASALGIPDELPGAVDAAVNGAVVESDIATVNGRCFINVSTGGFGAEATEESSAEIKRTLGPLAYVITGVKKFVSLESSPARFSGDEPIYEGPFLLFAVGNSRQTGGGNLLTPRADLTDGLLDVCIVREMPRMEFLTLLPDLRAGNHLEHDGVIYRRLRTLLVESEEALSVNADGEPLRERRFEYGISPHRLRLMTPRHSLTAAP
ncbi:lipid kinase YegS [soil metagenome]